MTDLARGFRLGRDAFGCRQLVLSFHHFVVQKDQRAAAALRAAIRSAAWAGHQPSSPAPRPPTLTLAKSPSRSSKTGPRQRARQRAYLHPGGAMETAVPSQHRRPHLPCIFFETSSAHSGRTRCANNTIQHIETAKSANRFQSQAFQDLTSALNNCLCNLTPLTSGSTPLYQALRV